MKIPEQSKPPIFFDRKQQRWPRFKGVTVLVVLGVITLFAVLIGSIASFPALPGLKFAPTLIRSLVSLAATPQPEATQQPEATPTNFVLEKRFQAVESQLQPFLSTPQPASPTVQIGARFIPVAYLQPTAQGKFKKHKKATRAPHAVHVHEQRQTYTPTPVRLAPAPKPSSTPVATHTPGLTATPHVADTPTPVPELVVDIPTTVPEPVVDVPTNVPLPVINVPTPGPRPDSQIQGFFVNWDDNSFTSLKQNISHMDKVVAEWLHLAGADGTLADDNPVREQEALAFIRQQRSEMPIIPLVNNFNTQTQDFDADMLAKMLADPAARLHTIQGLLDFVQKNHLAGISVDFENVPDASQPDLVTFMQELYAQFHPLGLEVSQSVPMNDDSFDYRGLAKVTDSLILMAYDQHWSTSPPGPVAAQDWFASALRNRLAEVPADHYIIALGNYGYDWLANSSAGNTITFQEAMQAAHTANAQVRFDPASLNPTFDYTASDGQPHQVWYLDSVTAFNQIVEAQKYGPRGFALWRLGSEEPSIWQAFDQRNQLVQATAKALEPMTYGYDIDYEGRGEILKVDALESPGSRTITYDQKTGRITSEQITKLPIPVVITRWGGEDKTKIALTFDDGPDAQFTPQILDILKQYQAPGTFFVIGNQAALNSTILQREINEGNEVGNHTFTHPDVSIISPAQFKLELAAAERLLESRVGRHTLLFRPPYGEDVEPNTPAEVKPLVFASDQGYYTVGMKIDPSDWKALGVDAIVNSVIDQAVSGRGNIILLHDGGGDRSQTVAALPRIITELRARGFELVSVSDLMGLTRDQVMPPITQKDILVARINEIGFMLIGGFRWLLQNLFIVGIVLGIARLLFIEVLAVIQWFKERRRTFPPDYHPSVSVLVPAYNEEKLISNTIQALLRSTYPNLEIIVIDDGSKDNTFERVCQEFGDNPRVSLFGKPNAGKAEALNFGLKQTQAEIVVAQDADTLMQPDAVEKLVRHMADPKVGAVAGNAKVGNRINLLTRWQALEYITSQNLDRRAFAILNCITVVPGAIGAWRRSLVLEAGGFDRDTLAEDADLTMRILRMGFRIEYDDAAIALTEAPDTTQGFLKQRFRWMYGTLQAIWKHKDTLLRPKYGTMGFVALPNILIFQILFPLISPIIDLFPLVAFATWAWQRSQHPLDPATVPLVQMLLYYVLFTAIDYLAATTAFILERHEDWRLLPLLFTQRFLYRQLMYYVAIRTILTAIRGRIAGWGKLERKATVRLAN